jgi:hypothetical protein
MNLIAEGVSRKLTSPALKLDRFAGFEVLTAVVMNAAVFWDVTADYKALPPSRIRPLSFVIEELRLMAS